MKYALAGIAAVILLWIGIVVLYGTQINVVYLCSRSGELRQRNLDLNELQAAIDDTVFAPKLRELFAALRLADPAQRDKVLKLGLEQMMGEGYDCPELSTVLHEANGNH